MAKINGIITTTRQLPLFRVHGKLTNKDEHPEADIIRLGISVTQHSAVVINGFQAGRNGRAKTFRGYGPEQDYSFLINEIITNDYRPLRWNSPRMKCSSATGPNATPETSRRFSDWTISLL